MQGKAECFIERDVKENLKRSSANVNVPKEFGGKKVLIIVLKEPRRKEK
jgi:putative transposon-encoded protein